MRVARTGRVALATLLAVMLLGGSASGLMVVFPTISWSVAPVTSMTVVDEDKPALDGALVAYEAGSSIRVRNLATGVTRTIPFTAGGTQQADPDVSGGWVVYAELDSGGNWDIRRYLWATNTSQEVAGTVAQEEKPRIDGNWVLWEETADGTVRSRSYDMGGHTSRIELTTEGGTYFWDVDNERLFAGNLTSGILYLRTLRPVSGWMQLNDFVEQITSVEAHGTRVGVAIRDAGFDDDVVLYDLQNDSVTNVAINDAFDEWDPSVFDKTVTYSTSEGAVGQIGYAVYSGFYTTPSFGTALDDDRPSLFGNRCAFRSSNGANDIQMGTSNTKLAARTSGANRYATAAAISRVYFSDATDVVLCNGLNFPDALSAAPLAKALGAPLLLTAPSTLSAETAAEIARLAPTKIWVIGGSDVVSAGIYNQLDATYVMERVAGADRYATSAAIARKLDALPGADDVFRAFFARGDAFPDALAVGPVAAAAGGPVMLVKTAEVPAAIQSAVNDLDITQSYVIGGEDVVTDAVVQKLKALEIANGGIGSIERWAGANRYATAVDVATNGLAWRWIDLDTVGFAIGTNFPDALGGGAALGGYGSALLLTSGTSLSGDTGAFLDAHKYEIGRTDVFGGSDVFTDATYNAIKAKIY